MKWLEALKTWNASKGGSWCVPKKGSPEHQEVLKIMRGEVTPTEKKKVIKPKIKALISQLLDDMK